MSPINANFNGQGPPFDVPRRNWSVGKDVLALGELRPDRRGEVGEPLLRAAVALVHRRKVLYPSRAGTGQLPFPPPACPRAQAEKTANTRTS